MTEYKSRSQSETIALFRSGKNYRHALGFLAKMNDYKREEDRGTIQYYNKKIRKEFRVGRDADYNVFWLDSDNKNKPIHNGKFMYVVSRTGRLYLTADAVTHSQIKAGKDVQCAGHLIIKDKKIIDINNSSGHYTPTSSMFLTCINGLVAEGYLGPQFIVLFDKFTIFDDENKFDEKFSKEIKYRVTHNKKEESFNFETDSTSSQIKQALLEGILENKTALVRPSSI